MDTNTASYTTNEKLKNPVDDTLSAIEQAFQDEIIDNRDESNNGSNFNVILYVVIIVFFVIGIGILLLFFYNYSDKKDEVIRIESTSTFQPVLNSEYSDELIGTVVLNNESDLDAKNQYQIIDKDGSIKSYIYSETIDLSIAQGLTVRIKGVPDIVDRNGLKVLNVSELEFK